MAVALQTSQFEAKLQRAMEQVKLILESEKCAQLPSSEHHSYEDKFSLVERATLLTLASQVNVLSSLGLTKDKLRQAKGWAEASQVSIRFRAEERCSYLREETREVEDPTKRVTDVSVAGMSMGFTSKTVTKVTEFFWKLEVSYELELFRGVGAESSDKLMLQSRTCNTELKTTSKVTPHPEAKVPSIHQEANITFLMRQLDDLSTPSFQIDRAAPKTKTPRRNPEVEQATNHNIAVGKFTNMVVRYLNDLSHRDSPAQPRSANLSTEEILIPTLPLFVSGGASAPLAVRNEELALLAVKDQEEPSPVISAVDGNRLLEEEMRTLAAKKQSLSEELGASGLFALQEAALVVSLQHCKDVTQQWHESMNYVEAMLRNQLIAAIGKEVTVADFAAYMRFHYRKLFQDAYMPAPFSFAVRRSEQHSPEGTISIEELTTVGGGSGPAQPVCSMSSTGRAQGMSFALNASTSVSFSGDVHLHAWLAHQFSGQNAASLSLVSRARQFSSFIVLVGRIISATQFDPKYAVLVQNKDELEIPLELSTIPTPKEFKDAIESLSPEQQAFAKAFRAMQLESTLFGIVVVQVKPQLEQLLNLPADSLTKEIKLTQDLMQLFIKYQIPSDLLSFSEDLLMPGDLPSATRKLEIVKSQVSQMNGMIAEEKKQELEERRKEEEFRRLEELRKQEEARMMQQIFLEREEEERCVRMEEEAFDVPSRRGMSFGQSLLKSMGSAFGGGASMEKCDAAPVLAVERRSMAVPRPSCAAGKGMAKGRGNSIQLSAAPTAAASGAASGAAGGAASGAASGSGASGAVPAKPSHAATSPGPVEPGMAEAMEVDEMGRDYTQVPKQLDEQFERLAPESALRPTIINPGRMWPKRSQPALLAERKTENLTTEEQKREKDAAFDLLDAITKSGALPLSHASMHIVVAATHCFDKTVTETVIQENLNPIEQVECSSLIIASTVHQQPVAAMIKDSCHARIKAAAPQLMDSDVIMSGE